MPVFDGEGIEEWIFKVKENYKFTMSMILLRRGNELYGRQSVELIGPAYDWFCTWEIIRKNFYFTGEEFVDVIIYVKYYITQVPQYITPLESIHIMIFASAISVHSFNIYKLRLSKLQINQQAML